MFKTIFLLVFVVLLAGCNPLAPNTTKSKVESGHHPGIDSTNNIVSISLSSVTASGNTDTDLASQPVIELKDSTGNLITTDSASSITLEAHSNGTCTSPVASGLTATTNPVTVSSGVGTFTGVRILKTNVIRIGATDGTRSVCSNAMVISPGGPASIAATSGTGQSAAHSTTLPTAFAVTVKDANNNVIPDETIDWDVTAGGGSLSSSQNDTNGSGVSSSTLTLGSVGTNTARARVNSNLAITVSINATATSTPFTDNWPFDSSAGHTPSSGSWLTSILEITGGMCRLAGSDQVDDDDSLTTGFDAGTFNGVSAYGSLTGEAASSGLKLGNNGGCDGSLKNCAELAVAWTPQWSNLVSYWRMNNSWNDSKNSNHGTANGNSTFTATSKIGSHAGTFDGTGDYINIGAGFTQIDNTSSFTISLWMNSSVSTFPNHAGIFSRGSTDQRTPWIMGNLGNGRIRMEFETSSGASDCNLTSTTSITANRWIHLVVRWDGTTCQFYFNGVADASTDTTVSNQLSNTDGYNHIGYIQDNGTFNGSIDDVAIWNTALTAPEIQTIYDHQKSTYAGTFTSRVMDALATGQAWTSLSWLPTLPFGKALPDATCTPVAPATTCTHTDNELSSSYSSLYSSALMAGIMGLWHLDNSWNDTSGNNNAGTANGNAAFTTTSKSGSHAGTFDGTGDYISIPDSNGLDFGEGDFSVSTWINPTSSGNRHILGKDSYAGNINNYTGFFLQYDPNSSSRKISFATRNFVAGAGGQTYLNSISAVSTGQWTHITAVRASGTLKIYINGFIDNSAAEGVSTNINNAVPFKIGAFDEVSANKFIGLIDEVAIWNRALHDNEIKQLYQRSASRLKFQVQSCNDDACSGETWKGPDGTAATYFSELFNMSTQAVTPSGTIKKDLSTMTFSNFATLPATFLSTNRWFRYRTIFESDSATAALQPELKSVTVAPIHYDASTATPFVISNNGIPFTSLSNFTQTLGSECDGGVGYNIGLSSTGPWKYWDGNSWETADGTFAQSNADTVIAANAATFVGSGSIFFKAYLKSDGESPCELSDIEVEGEQ